MSTLSLSLMLILLVACIAAALLIGFLVGRFAVGGDSLAVQEERKKHEEYKANVRQHFQETSTIMSRMVEDYRAIYIHMSEGAEQLAGIGNEKIITAPAPPEKLANQPAETTHSAPKEKTGPATSASSSAIQDAGDEQASTPETSNPETSNKGKTRVANKDHAQGDTLKKEPHPPAETATHANQTAETKNADKTGQKAPEAKHVPIGTGQSRK